MFQGPRCISTWGILQSLPQVKLGSNASFPLRKYPWVLFISLNIPETHFKLVQVEKTHICVAIFKNTYFEDIHPFNKKNNMSPEKSMVGRLLFFWNGPFSGEVTRYPVRSVHRSLPSTKALIIAQTSQAFHEGHTSHLVTNQIQRTVVKIVKFNQYCKMGGLNGWWFGIRIGYA